MAKIFEETAIDCLKFHWDPRAKLLSEEASTLQFHNLVQLFDDACDVGIHIRSNKTGKVEAFYLSDEHKNSDGDITHWEFKPVNPTIKCKVTIWND